MSNSSFNFKPADFAELRTSEVIAPFAFGRLSGSSGSGKGISWTYTAGDPNNYTVTFDTARANANYTVVSDVETFDDLYINVFNKTTTGFEVSSYDDVTSVTDPFALLVFDETPTVLVSGRPTSDDVVTITTTSHTIDANKSFHIFDDDAAGAPMSITLPAPSAASQGVSYKKIGNTANVTLTPSSGTIDGAASYTLSTQYDSIILFTDGTNYTISADNSLGGATDIISEGNSSVEVTDTGSNGEITFTTEGTTRWDITSAGHLLPTTNDTYDIGSAERKVRDFYLSSNSIKFVDDGSPTVHSLGLSDNSELTFDGKLVGIKSDSTDVETVNIQTYDNVDPDKLYHLLDDSTAGGPINVTLPDPSIASQSVVYKKIGNAHNVTLNTPTGTIDGFLNYTLSSQYQSITLFTDGVNYFVQ